MLFVVPVNVFAECLWTDCNILGDIIKKIKEFEHSLPSSQEYSRYYTELYGTSPYIHQHFNYNNSNIINPSMNRFTIWTLPLKCSYQNSACI